MIRIRMDTGLDADVAIVGGGPAGAAAACYLARGGHRVALFDQHRFPRDKVCGDFVGPAAVAEIERLGLLEDPVFRQGNQIRRAAVYLDGRKLLAQPIPQFSNRPYQSLCIPRLALDNVILNGAVASGARLLDEVRVIGYKVEYDCVTVTYKTKAEQGQLRARLLIGADGSSSLISRMLRGGPPPRRDRILAVRAYFEDVEGPQEQADLYFSSSTFPGYCWLFPTGDGSANVGVGTLLESYPASPRQQLSEMLKNSIHADAALGFRLISAQMRGKIVGWPLATFNSSLPMSGTRVLLIGDAAGLINPLNGEGIQYALQSARWAAETAAEALRRDEFTSLKLASYSTRVRHELRYDMAIARFVVDLISNRTLNPVWLQALRIIASRAAFDSEYAKLAGAILAGIAPARSALSYQILVGTIQQAAVSTGYKFAIDALHGPGYFCRAAFDTARATAVMALESFVHPVASLTWGMNCILSTIELTSQISMSVLEPHATAKSPQDISSDNDSIT